MGLRLARRPVIIASTACDLSIVIASSPIGTLSPDCSAKCEGLRPTYCFYKEMPVIRLIAAETIRLRVWDEIDLSLVHTSTCPQPQTCPVHLDIKSPLPESHTG